MATFFLIIIYMAFISLGLPDSLVGVAWPLMQLEFGVPFESAGMVSMFIAGGTIVSSLASGFVHKHLGTGKITFISCLVTAASLLAYSFAPSFIWLLLLAIPLGLGAGSVDSALNNYVALHYKAHHMSWLHCFWGVGATLGPIIMSQFIAGQNSWRNGFVAVSLIQFSLVVLLFFTLPLWDRMAKEFHNKSDKLNEAEFMNNHGDSNKGAEEQDKELVPEKEKSLKPLKVKGVKLALASFLFYCGVESTMGLWGSSFLVGVKGLTPAAAAQLVSMFYAGITIGRFITGFITLKLNNITLIRGGQITALAGAIVLLLPLPTLFTLLSFIVIGIGCAPIFPCMIHETPARFGKENSQAIIGYQMALAYTGATFLPPFLGVVAARTSIGIFPFFVFAYIVIMLSCSERINVLMKGKRL
ncbi:MAG TPA: MFS transporter [Pseudobacteroides sp.]|uniref:MFS transporter n=1 Tax=Pseudobacteroides sp. TaxID=1968840 RepID=UPI002F930B4E